MIKVVLFDVGQVLIRFSGPQFKLYKFANQLQEQDIQVAILSNVIMPVGVVLKKLHVYRGFNPVILSYEQKTRKPSLDIYEHTLKELAVKPEEIVFIDNLKGNLEPAKKMGMHIIYARKTNQVISDLKTILKNENGLKV